MADIPVDILIVGSGPAGVAAALGVLKKNPQLKIKIVDGGQEPKSQSPIGANLYDYCESQDAFELLVGERFEGLQALLKSSDYFPSRLTTPRFQFILENTREWLPLRQSKYSAAQTLSRGGLGNAWGAGAYRYNSNDLRGFPISESELDPFYDALTKELGISGANDDLAPFFKTDSQLLPPLKLSTNAEKILARYENSKSKFKRLGVHVGRARLAILSRAKEERSAHAYENLEFWQPRLTSIYTPAFTLDRLVREKKLEYQGDRIIRRFRREGDAIDVESSEISTGRTENFRCRRLILAAGAINSARIALSSFDDRESELGLLDNPALQIPFVLPWRIGARLDRQALGSVQLNMVYEHSWKDTLQSSLLDLTSPPRHEFFGKFPVAARANLDMIKYLLPAMMVNMVFFPSDATPAARLRLEESHTLKISGFENAIPKMTIAELVGVTRLFGGLTHSALALKVPSGGGIHYAGTLPMRSTPRTRYECLPSGELSGAPGVYVADGAALPKLAAKNHTFTLMANAMRIGAKIAVQSF